MKKQEPESFFEVSIKAHKIDETVKIKIDITINHKGDFINEAFDLIKNKMKEASQSSPFVS